MCLFLSVEPKQPPLDVFVVPGGKAREGRGGGGKGGQQGFAHYSLVRQRGAFAYGLGTKLVTTTVPTYHST